MTTITPLGRTTPVTGATSATGAAASTNSAANTADSPSSTVVSLSGATPGSTSGQALVWEAKPKGAVSTLMAKNYNDQPLAGRFKGLGAAVLRQFAYDGSDFSQSVQQAPAGTPANTYDTLISPSQIALHKLGDNQISLNITTRSGAKVTLSLDATDNGVAVDVASTAELSKEERGALGKLAEAFQKAVDGLTEDPPRVDLSGLTQFDKTQLSSVDLKAQIKLNPKETQLLEFHADSTQRSVNLAGPAGSARIDVDLSKPASWGSKEQQAKALKNYVGQIDQAASRGHGEAKMLSMFKDAFTDMNSDYGTPPPAPRAITLADQDHAMLTGLADFKASVTQAEVSSNPMRVTEKDSFDYKISQSTSVDGSGQLDRSISQQQQSQLKARFHTPVSATSQLAMDLRPESQNYKYNIIDDSATSIASIAYRDGALAKASLEMTANQSTRILKYTLGKLTDEQDTPSGKTVTRDLLPMLTDYEKSDADDTERAQMLATLNNKIFLQANPDLITA